MNLKVSGDGSWKKRGYSSLFGVTTLIGNSTGKVIDLVVKSSFFFFIKVVWNGRIKIRKNLKIGIKSMKKIVLVIIRDRQAKWKWTR